MEISTAFINASNHARTLENVSENDMLKLYGLYKQANDGPCNISKPYFWDFSANAKWKSWKSYSEISNEEAKKQYINLVKCLDTSWNETTETSVKDSKSLSSGMGVCVSTLMQEPDDEILDQNKSIFDWCERGDLKQLKYMLESDKTLINSVDDHKLTLLHWAADRGFVDILKYLIDIGCDINSLDEDSLTPLHYAVTCEHLDIVKILLTAGAEKNIKDIDGNTPLDCTDNKNMRSLLLG